MAGSVWGVQAVLDVAPPSSFTASPEPLADINGHSSGVSTHLPSFRNSSEVYARASQNTYRIAFKEKHLDF